MADCEAEFLINLVKSKRAIYDSTMLEHSNRNVLEKLWDEIAQEMNKSGKKFQERVLESLLLF